MAHALETVADILECKICLGRLDEPKMLACKHLFCKNCLEDVIKFNDDGSAVICCPLRCDNETYLDGKQTVNDLTTTCEIRAIIEALDTTDKGLAPVLSRCPYANDCNKSVSVYCCGQKMCSYCLKKHNDVQTAHEGKTSIAIDAEQGNLTVKCDEHCSRCTHVCTDITHGFAKNTFLCIYCLHRDHKDHTKDTIDDQAVTLKQALTNNFDSMETLCQLRKLTEENISLCKKKLDVLLRERTRQCLSKYIESLIKEEEMIRNELEDLSNEHMQQYPRVLLDRGYYAERLLKNGIDLVIAKSEILNTICQHNYMQMNLKSVNISLSGGIGMKSERPLGNLRVSDAEIAVSELDLTVPTFTDTIPTSYEEISSTLLQQMKDLMQGNVKEQQDGDSNDVMQDTCRNIDTLPTSDTLNDEVQQYFKDGGMEYVESLIQQNEIDKLSMLPAESLNLRNHEGDTPMLRATALGNLKAIKLFIDRGSPIEDVNNNGYNMLHVATENDRMECLQYIAAAYPVLLSTKVYECNTPLLWAAKRDKLEALKILIENGATLDDANKFGNTALHRAAANDSMKCMKYLAITYPTLMVQRSKNGATPVLTAAFYGKVNALKFLIERGSSPDDVDNVNNNLLHNTARNGHTTCSKYVATTYPKMMGQKNNMGNTPVLLAANFDKLNTLKLLIECGSSIQDTNTAGNTILHLAAGTGQNKCTQYLATCSGIMHPALMEQNNKAGYTALHLASYNGRLECIKILLAAGSDANRKEASGKNAVDLARLGDHTDCEEELKKWTQNDQYVGIWERLGFK